MPPRYRGTKGLIGIIANDSARYSLFASCVTNLRLPAGWEKPQWLIGGDWCGARNQLCQIVLDEGYTHLWFMDDDHAFSPDLLTRLASHLEDPEVAIVNPMCLTRVAPFTPVTYTKRDDSAEHRYFPIGLEESPSEGLVELEAAGCAGMLIRRDVIEAVKEFEYEVDGDPVPWFEYGDRSEDILFCEKAKELGFKLWGDLGARLGHITTCVVIPDFVDGDWHTKLDIGHGFHVFTPPATDTSWVPETPDAEDTAVPLLGEGCMVEGCQNLAAWMNPATNVYGCEEHPPIAAAWDDYRVADVDDLAREAIGDAALEVEGVTGHPCGICGNLATWTDVHYRHGCADHPEDHEAWQTQYERIEIWFDPAPEVRRWYGRALRGDGTIDHERDKDAIQEADLINRMQAEFPGLTVHQIHDQLDDSRRTRIGPPLRLWDH